MPNYGLEHTVPSEEKIEAFLRGEGSLDFRSAFRINTDDAKIVTRQAGDGSGEERQFLAIRGTATTAETDDNGVEVVPGALRSMPDDFSRRTTVLFNHDVDMPIGRLLAGESTKFVGGRDSRVEVNPVLIDVDVRLQTGQRVVDAIERGTLDKFSFAWSTRDGIVVFTEDFWAKATAKEIADMGLDEEDVIGSFRIGSDAAPRIRVFSLTAVELSVVSVPADAGAGFGMAGFARNFERAVSRYSRNAGGQIHIPERFQRDENGELAVPIIGGRAGSRIVSAKEYMSHFTEEEPERAPVQEVAREVAQILVRDYGLSLTTEEKVVEDPQEEVREIYTDLGATERPWDQAAARARTAGLLEEVPFAEEYFHYDVIDGRLVSNLLGLRAVVRDLDAQVSEDARTHLFRVYTEVHGVDPEEVPAALRECETTPEEVTQERE